MNMLQQVRRLLFPRVLCLSCDEPRQIDPGAALCDRCLVELESLRIGDSVCPHCLSPRGRDGACAYCAGGGMRSLQASFAPYQYHGVVQRLIVTLKFQGVHQALDPLLPELLRCLRGESFDMIVPVPLHKARMRERGFNQAALLAQQVQKVSGFPLADALIRVKKTKRQSTLPHEQRAENLKDAMQVVLPVKGKSILLVDDVRTTGSTARACADALLAAGAQGVSLLTIAIAHHSNASPMEKSPSREESSSKT
ncbi:MAG: ComF family protein [Clostridiales bacterium]|nr:ComF family protein [Clostridiales bacterium]